MSRSAYIYTVFRYVHDVNSAESLNVAVALWSKEDGVVFRMPQSFVRIENAFPGVDIHALRQRLEMGSRTIARLVGEGNADNAFFAAVASAFPEDENSLRAGVFGVELAPSANAAANSLLERFVLRCERGFEALDTDSDREEQRMWASISPRLIEMPVMSDAQNDDVWEQPEPVAHNRACVGV